MHLIRLNNQHFETHSTLESAEETVRCMRASGDYDSTDTIEIISYDIN